MNAASFSPGDATSGDPSLDVDVEAVVTWFSEHGRDLPWRQSHEPWLILVSELMLQQTQVARVVDRLPRFLDRFPSPVACSEASPGDVIEEWQGLGYNRRALNLHRSATVIAADHGGRVPDELGRLLALPGVGPYTARAVLAFAFERDVGVVDTNIARVLARSAGRSLTAKEAQATADQLVPAGLGWVWNQAVMEVGALLCRPEPTCDRCPLGGSCAWRRRSWSAPDPARGSAGVSTAQSPFEGSDRQGRGRLIDALRAGPVRGSDLGAAMGWPDDPDRASRVAATLVTDGLAVVEDDRWRLP